MFQKLLPRAPAKEEGRNDARDSGWFRLFLLAALISRIVKVVVSWIPHSEHDSGIAEMNIDDDNGRLGLIHSLGIDDCCVVRELPMHFQRSNLSRASIKAAAVPKGVSSGAS